MEEMNVLTEEVTDAVEEAVEVNSNTGLKVAGIALLVAAAGGILYHAVIKKIIAKAKAKKEAANYAATMYNNDEVIKPDISDEDEETE